MSFIKKFRRQEDGAVTVDWVVLTAAVVVLAGGVGLLLSGGGDDSIITALTDKIKTAVSGATTP